ncbi:hypothetical protein P4S72_17285 [Vibrio sp. PP-XX7]
MQRLFPSLFAALGALFVNQLFAVHPFIIWTCSVIYFDYVRRHIDSNLKARMATLPLFMIIFINTYANSSGYTIAMPEIARDICLSIVVVGLVASFINHLVPVKAAPIKPQRIVQSVTGPDRLKLLILVGGGLAFLMMNEVTTAVFCLVPLITSAMQPTHGQMKQQAMDKMMSQIGGCCAALIISMLFSGTEINLFTYFFMSISLVVILPWWCEHPDPAERAIHSDAMMGFLIPYQLYIGKYGNDYGLDSIMLRAFELLVALLVIYVVGYWLERMTYRPLS